MVHLIFIFLLLLLEGKKPQIVIFDIDFLVEMESGRNLLDRIGLIQNLEDYLDYKVYVATFQSL